MNVRQLLKITRKIFCWNIVYPKNTCTIITKRNENSLKLNLRYGSACYVRQQIKLNKGQKMKVESMTNYFWKRNFFVCQ